MLRRTPFAALAALALLPFAPAQAPDPAKPARVRKNVGDGSDVIAATFLGGKGHEWLCGGGFAPDGSVVLVGNVLGPVFDPGVPVRVIGTDRPAPAEPKQIPVLDKGKPKVDKAGNPVFEKPGWRTDGTTPFVAVCSADLKTVRSVHRFPWAVGAATAAAVGPDGAIYVAGRAAEGITAVGGDVAELPAAEPNPNPKAEKPKCDHAFVARLSPDATKAAWVRHVKGPAAAPTLTLSADGKQVRFGAGRLFVLDPAGKALDTVTVPGGLKPTTSVSPVDGTVVVGGEHHWQTGREPWRCPILNVHTPDGKLKYQFYDWGGPYVGLDNCRQVSDSAVRFVTHDSDGGILFYAWTAATA
ncbi:---NA--- : [Gemmataceae bacterium]|nr:---NA--- : [Gemmataceae bacterium]VTU02063.1 ---NA--- : [Gemmataceae bacterium]